MYVDKLIWSEDSRSAPGPRRGRETAAALLRAIGASLEGLALRLLHVQAEAARAEPLIEFHADAGAPEGALYVNGQLVGRLKGITRL